MLEMISREKAIQFYQHAQNLADIFSKDPSVKVGALLLAPDSLQILSSGYNGFPRGIDEKKSSRWKNPTKYIYVEHAERNCIYNAARQGTPLEGSIAITTFFPCYDCARALIQVGVKTVVSSVGQSVKPKWYSIWAESNKLFKEAGVNVIKLKKEEINKKIDVTIKFDE